MYWKPELLGEDVAWLTEHGYRVYHLDCSRWTSAAAALDDLGTTLGFPDYYGENLDAFNDCLGDVDVPADGGSAIVLMRYDCFAQRERSTAQAILDICASNARRFMLFGQRLATLVQSDDPHLSFDTVGSTPVMWNRREWLDKNRGL
ncbi:MAG TPA: barstar family protein [Burkholderiales bacterium]|nr:barstar family protein [Burkholderiales bacterium]